MNGSRSRAPQTKRIAIVTPWFGADLRGGAEQQSWQLARQLAERGHAVDVLTTCAAGFNDDWARNVYRSGVERLGPLTIRRFRVARRDRRAFERVNAILMSLSGAELRRGVAPIGEDDARAFYENGINSPSLYAYLAAEAKTYARLIFLPYLYGPTVFGLPLVAGRAFLQPCLHDEAYAYLPRVEAAVRAANGILFNSAGEFEVGLRLFGPGIIPKSTIVGEGIDMPAVATSAERVGSFVPSRERYVLYLGRQDPGKNVPLLLGAFGEFRRRQPTSQLRLVLAGERPVSYGDPAKNIVDLGPVSEPEKTALLAHARALAQPSTNESFSRVIYESWLCGRPVIVHRDCLPTQTAVAESGGGFVADNAAAWVSVLERVEFATSDELRAAGERGRVHARAVSSWPAVLERYERILAGAPAVERRIFQIVPSDADPAVGRYAHALAVALEARGFAAPLATDAAAASDGSATIRHLPTLTVVDAQPPGEDIEIYHAPLVFRGAADPAAQRHGGAEPRRFAASPAARHALARCGITARVLPPSVSAGLWDRTADVPLISALQNGNHNLVYVGPIASVDHLGELLIVFLNYLTIEGEARLTIAGQGTVDEAAFAKLFDEVRRLELVDRVLVARELPGPQLDAIFRVADVFITLDERETDGTDLLAAMWFDVPIIAYGTEIARTLVGEAGLVLEDKSDLLAVAALVQIVVTDRGLRADVIAAQRRERARFDTAAAIASALVEPAQREPALATEAT